MRRITLHTLSHDLSATGIEKSRACHRTGRCRLRRKGIVASVTPYATQYARLAPGLLNSEAEIETVLNEIRVLAPPKPLYRKDFARRVGPFFRGIVGGPRLQP